jgi:hypothetical protein
MKLGNTVLNHILDIVTHAPGCRIQDVAHHLPDLTLREVFYSLSYLSRKGQVHLIVDPQGGLAVTPTLRLFN